MIDTVSLVLEYGYFFITDPSKFSPSLDIHSQKYVQNPTHEDYLAGIYKPCLTLYNFGRHKEKKLRLHIQFSMPKLLYGNNVCEVSEKDKGRALEKLKRVLGEMGVKIFTHILENAKVSILHLCVNVLLTEHYTSTYVISELRKIASPKRFETNIREFRNNGSAYYFYNASHSVVLYDKIADLYKSKAISIDKEKTRMQLNMFDLLQKRKREVVRLEVRFTTKKKLDSVLAKYGYQDGIRLNQVFSKELSSSILKQYWEEYFLPNRRLLLWSNPQSYVPIAELLRLGYSIKDSLFVSGFQNIVAVEGIAGLKSTIKAHSGSKAWNRLEAKIATQLVEVSSTKVLPSWVKMIESRIEAKKALKLEDVGLKKEDLIIY